jgi:hypothetical protein
MDSVLHDVVSPYETTPPPIPGFLRVLRNVLTSSECNNIIEIAEKTGFVKASLYTDYAGVEQYSDIRKSQRCILDSRIFANNLLERLRPYIPAEFNGKPLVGINERLRLLKYLPGDEFKPHVDGKYTSPTGAISQITILLYLNVGYEGGYTSFHDGETWFPIVPETGMAALQDQDLYHGVPPVTSGVKYAIRTEVMYQMPLVSTGPYKDIVVAV